MTKEPAAGYLKKSPIILLILLIFALKNLEIELNSGLLSMKLGQLLLLDMELVLKLQETKLIVEIMLYRL